MFGVRDDTRTQGVVKDGEKKAGNENVGGLDLEKSSRIPMEPWLLSNRYSKLLQEAKMFIELNSY